MPRAFFLVLLGAAPSAAQPTARPDTIGAREAFHALNALRVDREHVYYVRELYLRKDVVRLAFTEGKLALLQSSEGRVTGAVFTGAGRAIAVPRDAGERRSLAWFRGTPLLDEPFARAYLRFTDETAEELLKQLRAAGTTPVHDASFADDWDLVAANLNPGHSLRILTDRLSANPQPYFYAGLAGAAVGAFEVILDGRREEPLAIGQPKWKEGRPFYDVWASFPSGNAPRARPAPAFSALSFSVSTVILPDLMLEGQAALRVRVLQAGERMIPLEMSRSLKVQSVADGQGRAIEFFQNEAVSREEILERGNDLLFVALPEAPRAGEELELRVSYQGSVISDAGNGVFFVGARGSWYPNLIGNHFTTFDLSFRWPRRLTLVATGQRVELREDGEWRIGRWQADIPIPVAGFNLGEYVTETVDGGTFKVEVYANKQLEQALLDRVQRLSVLGTGLRPMPGGRPPQRTVLVVPEPPPSPAALIKKLAQDVAESIRFYEKYHGPFPFASLAVSPIPASFGQGWPGLLYLTTLSFLPPAAQQRAGVTQRTQEQISELVPFHEVAHQWWGNTVGGGSYRDQWIHEGLASYLALLYAESKHSEEKFLSTWLDRFRNDLVTKQPDQEETPDEAGPLTLGLRLRSSKTAGAYERIFYGKGPWVFHMLRMMMRDAKAKNPDERLQQLLRGLIESYRHRALTTDDLERAVQKIMTPAMDLEGNGSMEWFFDQWVRSTGIPRYSVTFDVRPTAAGDRSMVRGTLKQSGVPETFTAAVPLYLPRVGGKPVLLGIVVTTGAETPFEFTSPLNRPGQARPRPRRLLLDPHRTLLCVAE